MALATGAISIEDRKARGAHYTPEPLAQFVAGLIRSALPAASVQNGIRILDPAIGDASLAIAILDELARHMIPVTEIVGFDTSADAVSETRLRLGQQHPNVPLTIHVDDFLLSSASSASAQTLFSVEKNEKFEAVIANPPYVRTQVLGAVASRRLAAQFGLSGRVDLYFAFLIGIARSLKPGGIAGIIVSNRFMTTRSGAAVRHFLREAFDIIGVYDLGDTRLFEAAVLPAVLLLRKRDGAASESLASFTAVYSAPGETTDLTATDVFAALSHSGYVALPSAEVLHVRHGTLASDSDPRSVWRLASSAGDRWLDTVSRHTAQTFGDLGRIRVGIKTTADKIFIRNDWDSFPESERPETLRPLITHHVASQFTASPVERVPQVLYTHWVDGGKRRPIPLDRIPNAARYLEQHRTALESRSYVIDAGREWYEIWVPHDPELWSAPKLVFRDISVRPEFWIDHSGAVVNGDCYWLTGSAKASPDLLYLALAVANSRFIESFYDRRFNNKLYSGRRRFITQYVEHFPLPDATTSVSRELISLTKHRCDARDPDCHAALEAKIDALVWTAFGLVAEETTR